MSATEMWTWILCALAFALLAVAGLLWVKQDPQPDSRQLAREALQQLRMANAARLDSIGDSVATMHKAWFDLHAPVDEEHPEAATGTAATEGPGVDQLKTVRLVGGAEHLGLHRSAES